MPAKLEALALSGEDSQKALTRENDGALEMEKNITL